MLNVASVSSAHSLSSHIRGKFRPATNLFPFFSRPHLADVFLFIHLSFKIFHLSEVVWFQFGVIII